MLRRMGLALTQPENFFTALARTPSSLAPPFLILLATVLVGVGLEVAGFLLGYGGPQFAELRHFMLKQGLDPRWVVAATLLLSPLSALILWVEVWAPARIGTGPTPRLFEVVGWCQIPHLLFAPLQGGTRLFLAPNDALAFLVVDLVPLCWSAALLFNGLRVIRPERATRGATVYLVVFLAGLFLEYLVRSASGGAGGPPAVL